MKLALEAVRQLCEEFRAQSGNTFWFVELLPGPLSGYCCSDALFSGFYKCFLGTYYHYCGTCRMASGASGAGGDEDEEKDKGGIVDESLRVLVRWCVWRGWWDIFC